MFRVVLMAAPDAALASGKRGVSLKDLGYHCLLRWFLLVDILGRWFYKFRERVYRTQSNWRGFVCNLSIRYGEKATEVALLEDWSCPKCRDICNCSVCMKKQGYKPTGFLARTAKTQGFSSVSAMLQVKGPEILKKQASSEKEPVVVSSTELGKENSFDGNGHTMVDSQEKVAISNEKHSEKTEQGGLGEISHSNVDDNAIAGDANYEDALVPEAITSDNDEAKQKAAVESCHFMTCDTEFQNEKSGVNIPLPQGSWFTIIEDVQLAPEDAGHALQFLEFCATFGQVLNLKKDKAESVIREITHGQSGGHCEYSTLPWMHIHLSSLILEDEKELSTSLSPTNKQPEWLQALEKRVNKYPYMSSQFPPECFKGGIDGYEKLSLTNKLRLLNFLCDEVLGTKRLRRVINDQQSVTTKKKKNLKPEMQDELAIAIMANNVASVSVSEHEEVVSQIKSEAAEDHREMLEAKGMVPQTSLVPIIEGLGSDAVRTEPILSDANGSVLWKLKCYSGEPNVLLQDMGTLDSDVPDDKWFSYDPEQKEEIEKCISSFKAKKVSRRRRRRAG